MKIAFLITAMSALMLSATPVSAEPAAPADKFAQAKPSVPNVAEYDKQMAQAQENMKKMQEQMDKIRQTQDPQERQKLLQDHCATISAILPSPRMRTPQRVSFTFPSWLCSIK